jgi:subtilisin family serine protease
LSKTAKTGGVNFDESYHPVRVPGRAQFQFDPRAALGFDYRALAGVREPEARTAEAKSAPKGAAYAVRAHFEDQEAIDRLKRERPDDVAGVYADPVIKPFVSTYCGDAPVGDSKDVLRQLGGAALRKAGLTGKKVRVAVVDTGIDKKVVPVAGGWGPAPGYVPGSISPPEHGTMCA